MRKTDTRDPRHQGCKRTVESKLTGQACWHTCNPRTQEAEAGGQPRIEGNPVLHNEQPILHSKIA